MLYFSKLRIISILLFTITLSFFTVLNFIKLENSFLQKKNQFRSRSSGWFLFTFRD